MKIVINLADEDRRFLSELIQGFKGVFMANQQQILDAIASSKQTVIQVINAEREEVTKKVTALEEKNTELETTVAGLQEQVNSALSGTGSVPVQDLAPIMEALQAWQQEQLVAIQGILTSAAPMPPASTEPPVTEPIVPSETEATGFTA